MEKRWTVLQADEERVDTLQRSLGINRNLCRILVQRGADDFDKARAYFRPELAALHDPWLLKDMDKAVARIDEAVGSGERILVFGDYDVDGTTAVACMYRFLRQQHQALDFYIPHRYREGYGVSRAGIDYAHQNGFTLIISLDCGIKSVELVAYAASLGIDFIICDHHLPDAVLPDAVAILNAKQPGCPYPFKELCGCGVGFKLIQALCRHWQLPDETWQQYLDLVAIAIAADIVPINGENRVLAFYGLKQVNATPSTGVKALLDLSKLSKGEVHINNLVFVIAPRVNAAGRMDDARKAVQLFVEEDYDKAVELAEQLHEDNTERREVDASITREAMEMLQKAGDLGVRKSTVLHNPKWHKGVVGIVASRLIEHYYRPTIILTDSGDKVAGSARSVSGFNVYEAIHQCKELLDSYGGHFYAAGLTMRKENVEAFCARFEEVVRQSITDDLLIPEIIIDTPVSFQEINDVFFNIVCQMEPFGPENMRPVFMATRVYESGGSRIVKEDHIKFQLMQNGKTMDGIGFGLAGKFGLLKPNVPLDVAFTIDRNEWNGESRLQLKVIDIRQSDPYAYN